MRRNPAPLFSVDSNAARSNSARRWRSPALVGFPIFPSMLGYPVQRILEGCKIVSLLVSTGTHFYRISCFWPKHLLDTFGAQDTVGAFTLITQSFNKYLSKATKEIGSVLGLKIQHLPISWGQPEGWDVPENTGIKTILAGSAEQEGRVWELGVQAAGNVGGLFHPGIKHLCRCQVFAFWLRIESPSKENQIGLAWAVGLPPDRRYWDRLSRHTSQWGGNSPTGLRMCSWIKRSRCRQPKPNTYTWCRATQRKTLHV